MGVKKLHAVFLRYVLLLALAVVLVVAANVTVYLLGVQTGAVVPLNRVSAAIESAEERLQSDQKITASDLPPLCAYALFTEDGQWLDGSIAQADSGRLWNACIENGQTRDASHLYAVIDRAQNREVLILRYCTAAQFSNPTLRSLFPMADLVLIAVILLEILFFLVAVSFMFGRYLGKRIDKLLDVVQKIEQQDLDFEIEKSKLFEIDRALSALDHMKLALKHALMKQWQDDKARQDQLSALAHDLKTPLTIIRGNTELLLDTALSAEQKECADDIMRSSMQMQRYVQTLLEVTTSWDSEALGIQQVPVAQFLQEIRDQIDGLCRMNHVTLHWACEEHPQSIAANPDLLMRALVNVLSNAAEHTPPGGTVRFETKEDSGSLVFVITDSGGGFTREALTHATEQFFMDDGSRGAQPHYGIGLYVAASIVRKHHGQLLLENSARTGGAMVTIRIPCGASSLPIRSNC